jgi:hypothetical protein
VRRLCLIIEWPCLTVCALTINQSPEGVSNGNRTAPQCDSVLNEKRRHAMLRGDAAGFDELAPMSDVRVSEAPCLRDRKT